MNYGIRIEYKEPGHKLMKGIYKLTIGGKYYIGKAKRLCKRMYQHQQGINGCLKLFPMPKARDAHYWRIARYLHENPKIDTIYVEMICRCVTAKDLALMEHTFLLDAMGDPDCLNGIFSRGNAYMDDEDLWLAEIKERILYYYNPSAPEIKYHQHTPLRANGDFANPKPIKSGG